MSANEKSTIEMVEAVVLSDTAETKANDYADKSAAVEAEKNEVQMTTRQAFRVYWKSVVWSIVASWAILMEGFGSSLGNFWVLEPFLEKYGTWDDKLGKYIITADWMMGVGQMASVGCVIGVVWGSYQCDRMGYRWTIISLMTAFTGFVALQVFSPNIEVLLVSNLFMGIVWGAMSMLSVSYASEVTPIQLRGYMCAFINLCWTIGGLLNSAVINGYTNYHQNEKSGYLVPWMCQWIWPVPVILGMLFAPESPWYLVKKGRHAEAEKVIKRIYSGPDPDTARNTVAMMDRTNRLEISISEGARYRDCFRGIDLRRTEIACVAFSCQILCGAVLSWNSVFFFVQAGLKNTDAFRFGLGQNCLGLVCTITSWFLLSRVGRRTIFLWGLSGMAIALLCMGFCAIAVDKGSKGALWAQATFLLVWGVIYGLSVGPVGFTVVGESSSTRLRNKTVGLGRMTFDIIAIPAGIINPYMINNTAWNWGGKSAFFWSVPCIMALVWCYFRLPEMKDRSFREIDILFERGVPARKFKTTVVSDDADDEIVETVNAKAEEAGH